jgi:hypothetical protein
MTRNTAKRAIMRLERCPRQRPGRASANAPNCTPHRDAAESRARTSAHLQAAKSIRNGNPTAGLAPGDRAARSIPPAAEQGAMPATPVALTGFPNCRSRSRSRTFQARLRVSDFASAVVRCRGHWGGHPPRSHRRAHKYKNRRSPRSTSSSLPRLLRVGVRAWRINDVSLRRSWTWRTIVLLRRTLSVPRRDQSICAPGRRTALGCRWRSEVRDRRRLAGTDMRGSPPASAGACQAFFRLDQLPGLVRSWADRSWADRSWADRSWADARASNRHALQMVRLGVAPLGGCHAEPPAEAAIEIGQIPKSCIVRDGADLFPVAAGTG